MSVSSSVSPSANSAENGPADKKAAQVLAHNLGFPRIGPKRELKFALESYWRGELDLPALLAQGESIRQQNWQAQQGLDWVPVGDFSFYDQVLDTSFLLGNVPPRVAQSGGHELDRYFRVARGRSAPASSYADSHAKHAAEHLHAEHASDHGGCHCVQAGEMTKWFDTNYHYIVPEVQADTQFELNPTRLLEQIHEARTTLPATASPKPVIIGPLTYLWLSKSKDQTQPLALLERLLPVYAQLLSCLADNGIEWVQIDEPILVTELDAQWQQAFNQAYHTLKTARVNILLATYFGQLQDNLQLACQLPVAGLHVDATSAKLGDAKAEINKVADWLPVHKVLSLGVISGRNIWKTHLNNTLDWLEPIAAKRPGRLWLAPSCSLLHVPVDLASEDHGDSKLDAEVKPWLAFAIQKLEELSVLVTALNEGRDAVKDQLHNNAQALASRQRSARVHKSEVKARVSAITPALGERQSAYPTRALLQKSRFALPVYPTTTIGSFPQTSEIRQARLQFKKGLLDEANYVARMQQEIAYAVEQQTELGLDVLVHGEAERNDMVEYFGEQLEGYTFSQFGWVQSYGSRCVKPPILFGDITRPTAMTVRWSEFAQSLTDKPMKGMLTGPVTILNWSFVRDDQPRQETCQQLALAIRDEVLDLERSGIHIIQIDEAALREGLPLRKSEWQSYLNWAVESFRICANGVSDETQIHTHMCYSEFNDIIEAIAHMDADVITIETSRSDMELLDAFDDFNYPNEIGPGVYDIHSPNIPSVEQMVHLMQQAARRIPAQRLWVNPDCGLKTRQWHEVKPALQNMVEAAAQLRAQTAQAAEQKHRDLAALV